MSEYESKGKRYKVNDTAWIIPLSIYLAINLSGFFAVRLIFALFISLNITFITWAPPFIGLFSLIALFALVLLIIGAVSKAKSRNSDTISKGLLVANQFFAVALVVLLVIALVAYIVIVAIYSSSIRSVIPESIVNIIIIALLLALAGIHSYYLLRLKPVGEEKEEEKYKEGEHKREEQEEEKQKTQAEIIVKTGEEVKVLDISAGEIKENKRLEELKAPEKEQQLVEEPSEEEFEKEPKRMPESKKKQEKEKEKLKPEKPEPEPGEKSKKIKCEEEEGEEENIRTLRFNTEEGGL